MQTAARNGAASFCFLRDVIVLSLKIHVSIPSNKICYLLFWEKLPLKMPASFLFTVWESQEAKKSFISHL